MTDDGFEALIDDVLGASEKYGSGFCSDCGDGADVHVDGIGEQSGSREAAGISLCAQCFREAYGE
jgi:hypothetical protein